MDHVEDHRNIFDNYAIQAYCYYQNKKCFDFDFNEIPFLHSLSVHSTYPDSEYEAVEIEFYTCH